MKMRTLCFGVLIFGMGIFIGSYWVPVHSFFLALPNDPVVIYERCTDSLEQCPSITCTNTTQYVHEIEYVPYATNCYEWQKVIDDFAYSHTYDNVTYNCVHYSNDLSKALSSMGYSAFPYSGSANISGNGNYGLHSWVRLCLDIEPQWGMVIQPNDTRYIR